MFKNLSPEPEKCFQYASFFIFKINKQTIIVRLDRMEIVPYDSTTLMDYEVRV